MTRPTKINGVHIRNTMIPVGYVLKNVDGTMSYRQKYMKGYVPMYVLNYNLKAAND